MHKLMNGEIDMMGDVSYTEERAESLLYPSLPMGSEDYYFFVRPGDSEFINKSLFRNCAKIIQSFYVKKQ